MENKYYVYVHKRVTDGSVFYVGKGKGCRAFEKKGRSKHWHNIVNKNGYYVEIVKDDLCEDDAFSFEIETIAKIGIDNLANMTKGGQGTSGREMPEKTIAYIKSEENRARVSAQWRGVKRGRDFSIKLSIANKGKKRTKKHIENQRIAKKKYMKKVQCINTGEIFESVYYAVEWLKKSGLAKKSSMNQIRNCCKERSKTAAGMQWRYIE